MADAEPALHFVSLNPSGSQTLLLLHRTLSSYYEFHLLLLRPDLQDHHLLLPDLPGHGQSSIAALLADLIKTHAKNGKADAVASNIRGYSMIYLTSKYPDIVSSVIATGCERTQLFIDHLLFLDDCQDLFWGTNRSLSRSGIMGFAVTKKLDMEFNDEMVPNMEKTASFCYVASLFRMLHQDWGNGMEVCKNAHVRTLTIAAGRQDIMKGVGERGQWLRKGDAESQAVVVDGARHAWICQVGEVDLFVRGVKAWVENEPLTFEYEVLDGVD